MIEPASPFSARSALPVDNWPWTAVVRPASVSSGRVAGGRFLGSVMIEAARGATGC